MNEQVHPILRESLNASVPSFKGWRPNSLYLSDNGCILCGAHLGFSARTTGRDISGLRVSLVTAQDRLDALACGYHLQCETCAVRS